jgi:NADPH2:quinone reductase
MRQIVCRTFGPVENLVLENAPDPQPRPSEVVVAVRAAGVNFVDALLVQGLYQIKPPLPFTPGNEIAGEVVELGAEVTGLATGERVVVSCGLGGFVVKLAVPATMARRFPARL